MEITSYKCDRCGKVYNENRRWSGPRLSDREVTGVMTKTADGLNERKYDLCDNCIGEFFEFIKRRKKEEQDDG